MLTKDERQHMLTFVNLHSIWPVHRKHGKQIGGR